ncbi:actin cytoskeleton-regulatory complex protein SLA1-like [Hyalella azteca]|uniref:Actin cytoskeleton-regulatory complex protein SLA1-like n=1 Tax=Hyalella azteca TaxID=294128 RepID=A0A8B7P8X6_HYAAZ|nr:actin cytoskeleton-regulatory complex protein SLA1-like [Hyalella azteca]
MKATLLLVAAVGLAVPIRSFEVKVVGRSQKSQSQNQLQILLKSMSEPTFYVAQERQSNRRHQTQRGSYLEQPNRYQNQFSSENQFNFGSIKFQQQGNRPTSGFPSHQVKYDNFGNPIRQQFSTQNQFTQPSGGRFSAQPGAGSSFTQFGQFGQSQPPSQFAGSTASQFAQPSRFAQPSKFVQPSQFSQPFRQQHSQFVSTPTGQIAHSSQFPQTFNQFGQQASNRLAQAQFRALNYAPVRQVSQVNQIGIQFGNQPIGFQQGSPSFGNQFSRQQQANFQSTGSSISGRQQTAPFGSVQQPNNFAG